MTVTGKDFIQKIQAYSKYAKYLPEHQRRETLDETFERNRDMHLKRYPQLKEEIEANFELMKEGWFLPAMRSLQFGGEAIEKHHARMFNCFAKNTHFLTREGYKTFEDYEDGDTVVVKTHTGAWKPAKVKSYGRQFTHTVKISKGKQPEIIVRVTGNHRWIKQDGSETTSLNVGDALMAVPSDFNEFEFDSSTPFEKLYWCYGYTFGDGTVTSCGNYSMVRLCKNQSDYAYRFEEMGFKTSSPLSIKGDVMAYTGGYLKQAPDPSVDSPELIRAFVAGYLAADGAKSRSKDSHSKYHSIVATGNKHKNAVETLFPIAGVFTLSTRDLTGQETNLAVRGDSMFYGLTTHPQSESTANQFRVRELGEDWVEEEVWCLEVEDDHSFVLEQGLVTGNCSYGVVDHPKFFSESMYLLLCGCGLGYSVRNVHINKLPKFSFGVGWESYVIEDSIEGWADAVDRIMGWAFDGQPLPMFDYLHIRPAGSRLSSGVIAPGPAKLQMCLNQIIDLLFAQQKAGVKAMTSLVAHDTLCYVADCVVSGGVRRCIAEGELVLTETGSYKPIEQVVVGDRVSTPEGWKSVTNTFNQGTQRTIKLSYSNGDLVCTPNHRVAVLTGVNEYEWKPAEDVKVGDTLFYVYNTPREELTFLPVEDEYPIHDNTTVLNSFTMPEYVDEEVAWFIGALHGDGYVFLNETHGSVSIASNQSDVRYTAQIVKGFEQFGISPKVRSVEGEKTVKVIASGRRFAAYLHDNFKKPHTPLEIPECIKFATESVKLAYIQGVMDADGCVKNRPINIVTSVYPSFVKEIQNLLYSCGVITRMKALSSSNQPDNRKTQYVLNLINTSDKTKFSELQPDFAVKKVDVGVGSQFTDSFPKSFVTHLSHPTLEKAGISNNRDRVPFDAYQRIEKTKYRPMVVTNISEHTEVPTYDIEVEDAHCFVCNGVLVHNSAMIVLFDWNDISMLECKVGNWWEKNPQRARANNSAGVETWQDEATQKMQTDFVMEYAKKALLTGSGDPAVIRIDSDDYGFNPCKPLTSLILTENGYLTFEQALKRDSLRVVGKNGQVLEATKPFKTREKAVVYRVYLSNGSYIDGTGNHLHKKIGSKVGRNGKKSPDTKVSTWDALENLQVGDYLEHNLVDVHENATPIEHDFMLGAVCGWIVADGWYTSSGCYSISFGVNEFDVVPMFEEWLGVKAVPHAQKPDTCKVIRLTQDKSKKIFELVGEDKMKFDFVREQSPSFKEGWISALFTADGSARTSGAELYSINKELLNFVQTLLNEFGVYSGVTIHNYANSYTASDGLVRNNQDCWRLNVPQGLFKRIGFMSKFKADKLTLLDEVLYRNNGYVRVVAIDPEFSVEDVYDITVHDESHAFIDTGVTTHNCCEALLYYNSCNLGEIIGNKIKTQEDFNKAAKAASFWCTMQAGYSDFKYLRPIWTERTKEESLIGVGITGIVDGNVLDLNPAEAAQIVKDENERVAKLIGINPAHRTTVIKPAGNSTLFAKCYGSGCHDAFSETSYVRRMRIGKTEHIYNWLMANVPNLVEDEAFDPDNTAVLSVPIRVTPGEVKHSTNGDPIQFLERVKWLYDNWIVPGHRQGPSTNNVSATCYVTPEQHEIVEQWMWDNRDHYKGISLLPKDNANYPQMPLEVVPDEVIDQMEAYLVDFDPTQIVEPFDSVNFLMSGACAGGACEIV